jgi:hypothetical protein
MRLRIVTSCLLVKTFPALRAYPEVMFRP